MQITTATRTVEIYANNEALVTYRNVKDGIAYGPVRTAQANAKAGSVGREVFDAARAAVAPVETEIAQVEVAAEVEVAAQAEVVAETEVAEIAPAATSSARPYGVAVEYMDSETGRTLEVTDWYGQRATARRVVDFVQGHPHARLVGLTPNLGRP